MIDHMVYAYRPTRCWRSDVLFFELQVYFVVIVVLCASTLFIKIVELERRRCLVRWVGMYGGDRWVQGRCRGVGAAGDVGNVWRIPPSRLTSDMNPLIIRNMYFHCKQQIKLLTFYVLSVDERRLKFWIDMH